MRVVRVMGWVDSRVFHMFFHTKRHAFVASNLGFFDGADLRFINLINNEPTIRTLLPLSPTGMEDPEDSDS